MNANSRYKGTLAALTFLFLTPLTGVRAQGTGNAAASPPLKMAVINIRAAIIATAEGKQAQAQLQAQFAPKQNDLQDTQKQIEDLQRRLTEGVRTLSQDEQAKLQRQGELLSHKLQRGNDDLNEELTAAQTDLIDAIGRKMLDVLDRYSRENGYTIVFDTSAQGTPVVYSSAQADVTQEIVRLYDQTYPIKSAPAASTPAPKPAAPAAPKKTTP